MHDFHTVPTLNCASVHIFIIFQITYSNLFFVCYSGLKKRKHDKPTQRQWEVNSREDKDGCVWVCHHQHRYHNNRCF